MCTNMYSIKTCLYSFLFSLHIVGELIWRFVAWQFSMVWRLRTDVVSHKTCQRYQQWVWRCHFIILCLSNRPGARQAAEQKAVKVVSNFHSIRGMTGSWQESADITKTRHNEYICSYQSFWLTPPIFVISSWSLSFSLITSSTWARNLFTSSCGK